ncbi:VOC family protein [Nocardioides cheoyonin]|uniref:VOC family protein n=1 Tax=Nocardioides cheoyonin TaxID=3156615 RepID=UPI003CCC8731
MTCQLLGLGFFANDPPLLACFWAGVLGRELDGGGVVVLPPDDVGLRLRFLPADEPKTGLNRTHFDLTSESAEGQRETVERALALGARPFDVGQSPDEGHVVLADPDGNEFCVIEPGNGFLAGCGFLGAVNGDGTQAVGYFWGRVLDWPLVWDHDEETAIQSPRGGPKLAWGGPPVMPKPARNRLFFEIAPVDAEQGTELDRLVTLGARPLETLDDGSLFLADPDGNEFRLLTAGGPGRRPRERRQSIATMTSEAFTTAYAFWPTARPSSSTASLVIEAVTVVPPMSRRTCEVVAPLVSSTMVPSRMLRALIFISYLSGDCHRTHDAWTDRSLVPGAQSGQPAEARRSRQGLPPRNRRRRTGSVAGWSRWVRCWSTTASGAAGSRRLSVPLVSTCA